MISDRYLSLHSFDDRVIPDKRIAQRGPLYRRPRPDDRVAYLDALEHGTRSDGDVRTDFRFLERHVVFDVNGIDDSRVTGILRPACAATGKHRLVRLDHRLDLASVVPALDIDDFDLRALVDHVLERVGEKILALILRLRQHVLDALVQQLPVLDVVKSDVGALGYRGLRLLDDLRHVAVLVGHDDAESLVVLYLLDPDDSISVDGLHLGKVGVENRVDEDYEHRLIDVVPCERDGAGGAVLDFLLDENGRHVHLRPRVFLDLLLQVARDVNDLLDVSKLLQLVEHVRHHRLARNLHHRFGREVRVRPETRSLAGQRNDHFHGALVPSRPYLSLIRTTSSSSRADTSRTSQSVKATIW